MSWVDRPVCLGGCGRPTIEGLDGYGEPHTTCGGVACIQQRQTEVLRTPSEKLVTETHLRFLDDKILVAHPSGYVSVGVPHLQEMVAEIRERRMGQGLPPPEQLASWLEEYAQDAATFGSNQADNLYIAAASLRNAQREKHRASTEGASTAPSAAAGVGGVDAAASIQGPLVAFGPKGSDPAASAVRDGGAEPPVAESGAHASRHEEASGASTPRSSVPATANPSPGCQDCDSDESRAVDVMAHDDDLNVEELVRQFREVRSDERRRMADVKDGRDDENQRLADAYDAGRAAAPAAEVVAFDLDALTVTFRYASEAEVRAVALASPPDHIWPVEIIDRDEALRRYPKPKGEPEP